MASNGSVPRTFEEFKWVITMKIAYQEDIGIFISQDLYYMQEVQDLIRSMGLMVGEAADPAMVCVYSPPKFIANTIDELKMVIANGQRGIINPELLTSKPALKIIREGRYKAFSMLLGGYITPCQ